jgi:hypothetical protein
MILVRQLEIRSRAVTVPNGSRCWNNPEENPRISFVGNRKLETVPNFMTRLCMHLAHGEQIIYMNFIVRQTLATFYVVLLATIQVYMFIVDDDSEYRAGQ